MSDEADFTLKVDIPALSVVAGSVDKITDAGTKGLGEFLGSLCLPAAAELGLYIQDKIRGWRAKNFAQYEPKVALWIEQLKIDSPKIQPRLLNLAVENASQIEEDDIQNLWAGLLAGSSRSERNARSSLLYMQVLQDLTPQCARLIVLAMKGAVLIEAEDKKTSMFYGRWYAVEDILHECQMASEDDLYGSLERLKGMGLLNRASGINDGYCPLVPTDFAAKFHMSTRGLDAQIEVIYGPVYAFPDLNDAEQVDLSAPIVVVTSRRGPDREKGRRPKV